MRCKCPKCGAKLAIITETREHGLSRHYTRCNACRWAYYSEIQRFLNVKNTEYTYRLNENTRRRILKEELI